MKIKVLFVCLGNICRSTMAEGVFREKIEKLNLAHLVECDSAGTANYHIGSKADRRTLKVLADNGIELPHRGRQISINDFNEFDYIFAMDKNNFRDINDLYKKSINPKAKVFLMREFDKKKSFNDVPDPYYGGMEDFVEVYEIVSEASDIIIENLISIKS